MTCVPQPHFYNYTILLLTKKPELSIRGHVVDCMQQVFQQRFDQVDNLETLEIHVFEPPRYTPELLYCRS